MLTFYDALVVADVIAKHQLDISEVNAKISVLESEECTNPNKESKLKDLHASKAELIRFMDMALESQKLDLEAQRMRAEEQRMRAEEQRMQLRAEEQRMQLRAEEQRRQLQELERLEELQVEISNTKAEFSSCGDEGKRNRLRIKLDELEIRETSRKSRLQALHASPEGCHGFPSNRNSIFC